MDEISGGRFLCGDGEVDLVAMVGEEFPELPWLKAKGYYVIEEFVANWVEIALRMSWAAAGGGGGGGGGGRKAVRVGKGVKEKAGLAANAFWREKGYVDWWMRLEPRVRARIMGAFFGKGTTALVICLLVLHFEIICIHGFRILQCFHFSVVSSMEVESIDACILGS